MTRNRQELIEDHAHAREEIARLRRKVAHIEMEIAAELASAQRCGREMLVLELKEQGE